MKKIKINKNQIIIDEKGIEWELEKGDIIEIIEKERGKIKIKKEQKIKDSKGKEWILEVGDIVEILNEAEKWSGDVKTSWDAPEGLFAEGSAQKIADEVLKGHKGDVGSAIKSINFYQNRAGVNLSDERKKIMQKVIEILQKKLEK